MGLYVMQQDQYNTHVRRGGGVCQVYAKTDSGSIKTIANVNQYQHEEMTQVMFMLWGSP
ncbi:hypothetical protein HanLR1_Chr06g0206471 [Helianthus annuus]|nr:hypothetical protein HanLR1_Chr06g0206471 [Helianthus annuus]